MINPNMGTMLAVVTTDAVVDREILQAALDRVADKTFNSITIDGDTSTNDTLLVFANGASGVRPDPAELEEALLVVCDSLSRQMVADGEGVTKFVTVRVTGAASRGGCGSSGPGDRRVDSGQDRPVRGGRELGPGGVGGRELRSRRQVRRAHDLHGRGPGADRRASEGIAGDRNARAAMSKNEITIECDLGVGAGTRRGS